MSDTVVDSSVVAEWVLPEADSAQAHRVLSDVSSNGERLIIVDLALTEVTNAIWVRHRRNLSTLAESRQFLDLLLRCPVDVETSRRLLRLALEISATYQRAVYDAIFVALAQDLGLPGVTADEALYRAVHVDFPQIVLLSDW